VESKSASPNTTAAKTSRTPAAINSPAARPTSTGRSPSLKISRATSDGLAPTAIRTPISARRSVTTYDSTL